MTQLRLALTGLARRSLVSFGIAALLIAGLLGMHAMSVSHEMPAASASMHSSALADGHDDESGASAHDDAGAMAMCGMVLLAAVGLGVASAPGLLRIVPPLARRAPRRMLRSRGEPRPCLELLSICRT